VAIFIEGSGCATAFPDLHSPVSVIGRNCEYIRDSGRYDHSAQRSNQKCTDHFSFPHSYLVQCIEGRHQSGFLVGKYMRESFDAHAMIGFSPLQTRACHDNGPAF
jgi:hypothetical protein